jgi:hypothetical protein
MEDLIELVAASFIRHGIDSPPNPPDSPLAGAQPEHNYQKMVQADPSP